VVSAPFLPFGDQGHKARFATLLRAKTFIKHYFGSIVPVEFEPRNVRQKAERELGDPRKLGTESDKTKPPLLGDVAIAIFD
jgi:hypothetical protein